jgi:hypothetical protein
VYQQKPLDVAESPLMVTLTLDTSPATIALAIIGSVIQSTRIIEIIFFIVIISFIS